jgi:hypothetical protein
MYYVINEDYPRLETYLCYECGFHADSILMGQTSVYQTYQELFIHTKEKFGNILDLKRFHLPTENQQRKSNTDKPTEPNFLNFITKIEPALRF